MIKLLYNVRADTWFTVLECNEVHIFYFAAFAPDTTLMVLFDCRCSFVQLCDSHHLYGRRGFKVRRRGRWTTFFLPATINPNSNRFCFILVPQTTRPLNSAQSSWISLPSPESLSGWLLLAVDAGQHKVDLCSVQFEDRLTGFSARISGLKTQLRAFRPSCGVPVQLTPVVTV